ncbi:uncharacterized protein BDW70DRAFT_22189 [Aspergillus foveolatus]|uniref:uncharacterized protein n=1 Tax=Aspergillus foveolatus TaxID=210207 RepID=UPI003CCCD253
MVPEEVTLSQLWLPPQLYQARYHHVDGSEVKARLIVRTLVQVALELLSDDDQTNDVEAYGKLVYLHSAWRREERGHGPVHDGARKAN